METVIATDLKVGIYYNESYTYEMENPLPPQSIQITVRKVMPKTVEATLIRYEGNGHPYSRKSMDKWKRGNIDFLIEHYELKYIGESW